MKQTGDLDRSASDSMK